MKNKKILFIFAIICILIFLFIYYIFSNLGNNKNRSQEEIVESILNEICKYEANITVEVYSNKNENVYEMHQLVNENSSKTIVKSPEEIENLSIENENNKLKVKNTKLDVEKIYENYAPIINNNLFLNVFSKDCFENNFNYYEQDNELILEVKLENSSNTYSKYKELHYDLTSNLPRELIIKDNTKKTSIRIIYNDIKIK